MTNETFDKQQVFAALEEKASNGDDVDRCELARFYYDNEEYEKALALLEVAARNGSAHAMFALSDMYRKGLGVPQDDSSARTCLLSAAKLGHPFAQYNIGAMYMNDGNEEQGQFWLKQSIETLAGIAESAIDLEDYEYAKEMIRAAVQIATALGELEMAVEVLSKAERLP